jgi:hypothetical protein
MASDLQKPLKERLEELVRDKVGPILVKYALALYNEKLTPEEQQKLDDGTFRLPKMLVQAIDPSHVLGSEIGAESMKIDVARLRRIKKSRMT